MAITSEQITNAAMRHGDESGEPDYAIGDLEIALRITLEMLKSVGLADQYETAIKDGIGLESLNEYLADRQRQTETQQKAHPTIKARIAAPAHIYLRFPLQRIRIHCLNTDPSRPILRKPLRHRLFHSDRSRRRRDRRPRFRRLQR